MKIIGIEVAKASILCCELDHIPTDPVKYAKSYKPVTYTVSRDNLTQLASSGDIFVLEPTGVYSRIWYESLKQQGKDVRKVSPKRITHLRRSHGVESKSDRYDAFFIALYGQLHHGDRSQFLAEHAEDLRELVLTHQRLTKQTTGIVASIWRSLSFEWPECCLSSKGSKPQQSRPYGTASPPALFRFLAGEKVQARARRQADLDATAGIGLSGLTRLLATQVCDLERYQYSIEEQISALLQCSEFEPYQSVFDSFDFGPMTRAVLLSRVFPIERFLDDRKRPIVEYVPTDRGRSKRYVSLGSFKLSLGMGTVIAQSGNSYEETPGGPRYARTALFLHAKTKIVMKPPQDLTASRRVEHRRYYENLSAAIPHNKSLMKVCSKISKDLFKDLVKTL